MAASSALEVAVAIALAAKGGRACSMSSMGLPTMLARRAAKLGCSRTSTARFSAVRSAGFISWVSLHGILGVTLNHVRNNRGAERLLTFFATWRNQGPSCADVALPSPTAQALL